MCPWDDPQGLWCPGPTHSQHRAADLDMLFASGSSILGKFINHVMPLRFQKSLCPVSFWYCLVMFVVWLWMLTEGVLTVWNGSNLQSWPNFMAMMWLDFKTAPLTAPFAQLNALLLHYSSSFGRRASTTRMTMLERWRSSSEIGQWRHGALGRWRSWMEGSQWGYIRIPSSLCSSSPFEDLSIQLIWLGDCRTTRQFSKWYCTH